MRTAAFIVCLFLCAFQFTNGVRFECLPDKPQCSCDTEQEAIHCHSLGLTTLPMPESGRLRGFTVIGLTGNPIRRLPSQEEILKNYPDISVIDVEGNAVFDCDSRAAYTKLTLLTDCDANIGRPNRVIIVPPVGEATEECDLKCKMEKHYLKLRDYLINVWERIKVSYDDIDKEQIINEIKQFIRKLLNK